MISFFEGSVSCESVDWEKRAIARIDELKKTQFEMKTQRNKNKNAKNCYSSSFDFFSSNFSAACASAFMNLPRNCGA